QFVVLQLVQLDLAADGLQLAGQAVLLGVGARVRELRDHDGGQDAKDDDHDENFDKGETLGVPAIHVKPPVKIFFTPRVARAARGNKCESIGGLLVGSAWTWADCSAERRAKPGPHWSIKSCGPCDLPRPRRALIARAVFVSLSFLRRLLPRRYPLTGEPPELHLPAMRDALPARTRGGA